MQSIYSNIKSRLPNVMAGQTPKQQFWHWLMPILISISITGGGIAMFAGGLNARMVEVEKKHDRFDQRLDQINNKLDGVASKEDLREIKQDMKDRYEKRH